MNPLTVIIPSRNVDNLIPCVDAVRKCEPNARIIVVDDGLPQLDYTPEWAEDVDEFIAGAKPFVFARNCNLGIDFARCANRGKHSDVVLLNDDALLESPGGFTAMQRAAHEYRALAIVSATTNVANNPAQFPAKPAGPPYRPEPYKLRIARRAPGFTFPTVAFVCVLIPSWTIETIGMLDERFVTYGWEDVDYCRRVHEADKYIGIHDCCFVDHSKLRSTFRGDPHAPGPIDEGREIYLSKWGKL